MNNLKTFENLSSQLENSITNYKKYEHQLKPLFKEIIDSNNITEIRKTIDELPKVYISPAQFLFRRIYELENNLVKSNSIEIDFNIIREKIKDVLINYVPAYLKYEELKNNNDMNILKTFENFEFDKMVKDTLIDMNLHSSQFEPNLPHEIHKDVFTDYFTSSKEKFSNKDKETIKNIFTECEFKSDFIPEHFSGYEHFIVEKTEGGFGSLKVELFGVLYRREVGYIFELSQKTHLENEMDTHTFYFMFAHTNKMNGLKEILHSFK